MKFVVDESTGEAVVNELRRLNHDVISIHAQAPGTEDSAVLNIAALKNRLLLTNDKDFGELVYRSGLPHHGVVLFRLRDERAVNRVCMLKEVLKLPRDKLTGNYFIVVSESKIRIRRP